MSLCVCPCGSEVCGISPKLFSRVCLVLAVLSVVDLLALRHLCFEVADCVSRPSLPHFLHSTRFVDFTENTAGYLTHACIR